MKKYYYFFFFSASFLKRVPFLTKEFAPSGANSFVENGPHLDEIRPLEIEATRKFTFFSLVKLMEKRRLASKKR